MSYIDAYFDSSKDILHVVERIDDKRIFKKYPISYTAYYNDKNGQHQTIFGNKANPIIEQTKKKFSNEIKLHHKNKTYETDLNWIFQTLSKNYSTSEVPKLHTIFFDIEVDFDPEKGFAPPTDPFAPITSISFYLSWLENLITIAIPPPNLSIKDAINETKNLDNVWLYETEKELLLTFLNLIEDADVISGWNSEGFDIPYLVNRITYILGKDYTKKLCLWNLLPKPRNYIKYGKEQQTYDLIGRLHLDYLELYRKYTYHEMHSYSLDAIGEYEVGDKKIIYEGSIDKFYREEFNTFIKYNQQDTLLLVKIDQKNQFIDLANNIAHANTVLLPTTMGSVAVIDQAIINKAHQRNLVLPNRKFLNKNTPNESTRYDMLDAKTVVGGYVASPKKGIHEYIGGIDINSLYPSIIRAMNMSPETIVGQLLPTLTNEYINNQLLKKKSFADSWEGIFSTIEYQLVLQKDKVERITLLYENKKSITMTGAELHNLIFKQMPNWCLSANGTIFDQNKKGIIPDILENWYDERKKMQKTLKNYNELLHGIQLPKNLI